MAVDLVSAAGLVTREVRTDARGGEPTRIVVARRSYPTDRADLWDAVTNPERIPRWFAPVEGDLRVGGRYQVVGNAGGVVERCDEPSSFAITWEMDGRVSWVAVSLVADSDDATVLELVHEAPIDPEFAAQFGPGAVGVGWDLGLLGLAMYLDTGEPVDPETSATFTLTPEGVAFVEHSATGWADAAAADGDPHDAAHEAAARTIAFYTTLPDDHPDDSGGH